MKSKLTNFQGLSEIGSIIGSVNFFCYIYYLDFVLLIVITAAYGIRLLRLNDQSLETKILLGGSGVTLLFCLISFGTITTIKSVASGDFSSFESLGNIEEQIKFISLMLLFQVATAGYAGFLFYGKKRGHLVDLTSVPTQMDTNNTNAETTSEPKISIVEKFKAYYATSKGKKNIRIGGAAISVVLIAFISINVINSMKRTPIDLTKNCKISFRGISGEGNVDVKCKADYDMNKPELKNFVNSITYEVESNGTLKNDDIVKITANYSEATAESLKLKPENTTKEVKVEGLEVVYMKFEEIPSAISTNFETATKEMLEVELKGKIGGFLSPSARTIDKMECIATYYVYSKYSDGTAYYIYRAEETVQYSSTNTEKQINYYRVNIENINSVEEVDLTTNSNDLEYSLISSCDKEGTDEMALNSFKSLHKGAQIVKETPSALTYKNEKIKK